MKIAPGQSTGRWSPFNQCRSFAGAATASWRYRPNVGSISRHLQILGCTVKKIIFLLLHPSPLWLAAASVASFSLFLFFMSWSLQGIWLYDQNNVFKIGYNLLLIRVFVAVILFFTSIFLAFLAVKKINNR